MILYALTIGLSAFLLFAVQPVIAKMILPWFGGSSAVWSTCMLFFQLTLLLGYLYAHWLNEKLRPRAQAAVHTAALAISMAALPILPNPMWKTAAGAPSLKILALLAVTIGLPYFLLSSTSPLLQAWYARTHKSGMPYRLFALSNFASMLALLSYPLLVEPNLPTRMQAYMWSAAFVAFAVLCAIAAWRACLGHAGALRLPPIDDAAGAVTSPPVRLLWFGLSASASILLLAVTNHLTQDVAAIPFLWIVPLAAYLLSFILCFEAPRLYNRMFFVPLLVAALTFMMRQMWTDASPASLLRTVGFLGASLFIVCMVCHGELARLKPHPRHLTSFYAIVSLGGAMGGLFVGLAAPNLFRAYYEFPLGLGVCAAVIAIVYLRESWPNPAYLRYPAAAGLIAALGIYLWGVGHILNRLTLGYRLVERNFYGQLRVLDDGDPRYQEEASRTLVHGTINHGAQFQRDEYRRLPVTYFCPESGVGRGMRALGAEGRRIGVIGMGCGTLAAYGKSGDALRIYEINPLVWQIARTQFTYLRDTPAKLDVSMGDARLSLEAEPSQQFDILVVDAFSGDAVPVHLLTVEAFRTYFRHLKPGGILALNTTNRYLDLNPVMAHAAAAFGKIALHYAFISSPDEFLCFDCDWTLIMDRSSLAAHPGLERGAEELKPLPNFRTWTDDFSNLYSILR
jgi:SAM-dependent methyltransferase